MLNRRETRISTCAFELGRDTTVGEENLRRASLECFIGCPLTPDPSDWVFILVNAREGYVCAANYLFIIILYY